MNKTTESKNIVVFWPNDDWGMYGRTYEKITEHLARLDDVNRVVCIFPPTEGKRYVSARPLSIRKASSNLWLMNENRMRPGKRVRANFHWSTVVLRIYVWLLGFRKANTIMWLFPPHPYLEELMDIVPHSLVVTQLVDNFMKFDPSFWLHEFAKDQYPRITQLSDKVITSSQANYDEFSQGESECYLFENAVDASFIGEPSILPFRENDVAPRLGYVGWLTERADLSLLEYVARKRPEWSILIAGPQRGHIVEESTLVTLPNVSYLGPLPYNEVAGFLQTLDVCLIPHRDTPYSKSMSPLKLYQYLASGRPIVSSEIAGLERFRENIHVADSYDDFISHIEDALNNDTVELSSKRIEKASNETWDKRIRDVFNVIRQQLVA